MRLTEEQAQVRDMVRRFADEAIRPVAGELDESERFPAEIYARMAGLGLFGIAVPAELGGAGLDTLSYALVMEELSRGYASVADQCGLVELIATLLSRHGTPAQRERYLAPLLRGERRCAYAITEAEAGSDVAGIRTTATRTPEGWRLDGGKLWIHNAPVCDFAVVLARTDPEAGRRGMSILHRRRRPPRLLARPQGAQDGPARLPGRRAALRRRGAAGRRPARPGGARLPHHDERARQGPGRDRGARRRHRPGRARGRARLRPPAAPVRQADRPSSRASSSCWPTWRRTSRRRAS